MATREELLRQADELDERASALAQAEGDRLRTEAAGLRVSALGEKPYPVLVCAACFRLTGWLGSGDRCETCLDRELRKAAYADPSGGWVDLTADRPAEQSAGLAPSGWKRAAAAVGWRRPLREARLAVWLRNIDPGETGPMQPEEGFELAVADRAEDPAPEGGDLLVRFYARGLRFEAASWQPRVGTALPDPLTPNVFAASLPIDQLAEAWNDFRAEVDDFSRARWSDESARRERERAADEELLRARREQRGTSSLLD
jgi:hypothetical protein